MNCAFRSAFAAAFTCLIVAAQAKADLTPYHAGSWEKPIGYSQAVRAGNMLYVSGTVGGAINGRDDLNSQMISAYEGIRRTLAHFGTNFSHVVMEHIYTTDMHALIASEETRKRVYGKWLPAATWVEVRRLYDPSDKIEIEVQVELK